MQDPCSVIGTSELNFMMTYVQMMDINIKNSDFMVSQTHTNIPAVSNKSGKKNYIY